MSREKDATFLQSLSSYEMLIDLSDTRVTKRTRQADSAGKDAQVTSPRLCLILSLSILSATASAASAKEHAAESVVPAPAAGLPVPANAISQPAESAGTAASLPDVPMIEKTISFQALPMGKALEPARPSRISFTTQQGQGVSPLASMPFAGTARRLGAQRFNTEDGSMLNDFAICYRMSGRSSIEIIPGDPAPVKLPVVSMANNTGVTVGLVLRLSR